jgi:hypothetical protein
MTMSCWTKQFASRSQHHNFATILASATTTCTSNGGTIGGVRRQQQLQQQQLRRTISTKAAMRMLGFPKQTTNAKQKVSLQELRTAYFELAKRTHPDLQKNQAPSSDTSVDFRDITEAYEHLLKTTTCEISSSSSKGGNNDVISKEEEDFYRQACTSVLGIPAEIVEESKQNPMFLLWLGGNTDAAQHWRAFFAVHGGLAQKLRVPAAYLEGGAIAAVNRPPSFETRRRRGKR